MISDINPKIVRNSVHDALPKYLRTTLGKYPVTTDLGVEYMIAAEKSAEGDEHAVC